MKWTPDQQKVIDLRNRNILVSAAAGSGKTAVLVERIITMITEGENPIDIDRLLIVTFTNAAAAEMRERISAAINKKITEMPENKHLQKQATLIHSAQITTIHSFCLGVIRNHFNIIDLDPTFRIADEAELTLLKSDVLGELLEQYYDEGKEEFLDFIESFSSGKSDSAIEDLVLKLHGFSMSYPWPEEWLEEKKKTFHLSSIEEMRNSDWMKALLSDIKTLIEDMAERNQAAIRICEDANGPKAYLPALRNDRDIIESLLGLQEYDQFLHAFGDITFARLSGKKEEGVEEDSKAQVKAIREEIKKAIGDIKKNYFFQSEEEMYEDIMAMQTPMDTLIDLTKDFGKAYAEKKADKNIVDFHDLEHYTLRILTQRVENEDIPTPTADELSEQFSEILIDEYQDSNLVQEMILNSITRERFGKPNLFMVGDVKQSIYKFRLARPEIFMEKFETYDTEDSCHQRVDLHQNFRSREVVLNSINFIFEQIMTKKLGNIWYNEEAALYPGADFGEETVDIATDSEIILVDVDPPKPEKEEDTETIETLRTEAESKDSAVDTEEEYTAKELEARAIARRIKELTDPVHGLMVYDKSKQYRRAKMSDIVILLRTMSNWAEIFADTFAAEGITAHTETQSGYFSTIETRTILNLLRIIDNPRQDIPFTAVLRSPIVELNSEDLAIIRIPNRRISMYEAVLEYINKNTGENRTEISFTAEDNAVKRIHIVENDTEEKDTTENDTTRNNIKEKDIAGNDTTRNNIIEKDTTENDTTRNNIKDMDPAEEIRDDNPLLAGRLNNFLVKLEQYRAMVSYLSIDELIRKVLEDTGYYYYAAAMPAGEKRKANMDMLIQRAIQFEATSYHGLFHFIRYIEKLHKYDIDFGEAKVVGENENAIRIMSIHKSKGLEFPIVFVAGMGKTFNNQDSRSKLIIHPDLGLGPDYMDYKLRVKAPTLVKKVIQRQLILENLGEELRVLYVAMTRAKEKLILTGGVKKLADKLNKWQSSNDRKEKQLLFYQLSNASTYLDWIIPAVSGKNDSLLSMHTITYEELSDSEYAEQIYKKMNQDELYHWNEDIIYDDDVSKEIRSRLEFQYPFKAETNIHTKLTVSELKRLGQLEMEDLGIQLNKSKSKDIPVPKFMKQTEVIGKADRGTLYHKILEYMKLAEITTLDKLSAFLESLLAEGKLNAEEYKQLDLNAIYTFTRSPIAERMRSAEKEGRLFKERQFIMGIQANEINKNLKSKEMVLVQGVIDVYFEEAGKWVLLDYKTDAVMDANGESLLKNRYKVQLDYYQKALEQLTGVSVKEKIIYSFELGKALKID